jgi:hypothetical protein
MRRLEMPAHRRERGACRERDAAQAEAVPLAKLEHSQLLRGADVLRRRPVEVGRFDGHEGILQCRYRRAMSAPPYVVIDIVRAAGEAVFACEDWHYGNVCVRARAVAGPLEEPREAPSVVLEASSDEGASWSTVVDLGEVRYDERRGEGSLPAEADHLRLRWALEPPPDTIYWRLFVVAE